jgi:hypothetical protein
MLLNGSVDAVVSFGPAMHRPKSRCTTHVHDPRLEEERYFAQAAFSDHAYRGDQAAGV